jgi:uncharacterized protein (TIGR01244 family)
MWAAGVQAPGIPNFQQVNERIFRGGQPSQEGFQNLAKLGVKTVIDLRRENEEGEHSTQAEKKMVETAGMRYVNVPMKGIVAPTDEQVSKVLAAMDAPGTVFVHCKKGKDRTGTVVACYRITHDSWKNQKALAEAKSLGLHWVEMGMKSYINAFRGIPAAVVAAPAAPAPAAAQ